MRSLLIAISLVTVAGCSSPEQQRTVADACTSGRCSDKTGAPLALTPSSYKPHRTAKKPTAADVTRNLVPRAAPDSASQLGRNEAKANPDIVGVRGPVLQPAEPIDP